MMDLWKWAFRNLWRQKRRTLLNATALGLGMAFLYFGLGWIGGYNAFLFKGVQDFDTGQAQWIRTDYLDQERRTPLDLCLDYAAARDRLAALPGVREASGRLDFTVTVGFQGHQAPLMARAVDEPREARVTVLRRQTVEGTYGQPGILLGQPLARLWGVHPGDTVFLTAVDRHGAVNFVSAPVAGIYTFGYPALDRNVVFMDLETAWHLLDMKDRVSRIALSLNSGVDPVDWVRHHQLTSSIEPQARLYSWKRFARETVSAVASDSGTFYLVLIIVLMLATLGLLNSLSMSIHERQRELGTLRALGLRDGRLSGLIVREGVAMGVVSALLAAVLAFPIFVWLGVIGLDLRGVIPADLPFPFGDRFRAVFTPSVVMITLAAGLGASLVGSLLPAWRASRVRLVDALAGRRV